MLYSSILFSGRRLILIPFRAVDKSCGAIGAGFPQRYQLLLRDQYNIFHAPSLFFRQISNIINIIAEKRRFVKYSMTFSFGRSVLSSDMTQKQKQLGENRLDKQKIISYNVIRNILGYYPNCSITVARSNSIVISYVKTVSLQALFISFYVKGEMHYDKIGN